MFFILGYFFYILKKAPVNHCGQWNIQGTRR
jgi:hypothetical protein